MPGKSPSAQQVVQTQDSGLATPQLVSLIQVAEPPHSAPVTHDPVGEPQLPRGAFRRLRRRGSQTSVEGL